MKRVEFEHAYNFRDFGGYATKDGKHVKTGLLYRSDELCYLSENDIKKMEELGIRSIVDYRSEREKEVALDKEIPGATVYYFDPKAAFAQKAADQGETMEEALTHVKSKDMFDLMANQYKEFVTSEDAKKSYAKLLKLIVDIENVPFVNHCRAGKDRTGYGSALILSLLGVDRDTIVADYMETNDNRNERDIKELSKLTELYQNEELFKAINYLAQAHSEYIIGALDLIDEQFGGTENYVMQELHLTKEEIEKIRDNYLE